MEKLPSEIIDIILEFQGYHRLRNGKYITQLNLNDKKYDKVKRKPMIQIYNDKFINRRFKK
jgi:hypothetical protein